MLAWGLTTSCASTQFDGTSYRGNGLAFRVAPTPSGWRSIQATGALLAYRDDEGSATIAVGGRCGKDGDDVPLEALTHHLFIHFTERDILDQKRIAMDGREALRTSMLAKLDGVAHGFVVVVLKKDGCVYDFLYVGPASMDASRIAAFDRYVGGFRTEPR